MYNRYAPFFSGGGYCSEATSIVFGLKDVMPVQIIQHGDQVNFDYMIGLPKVEKDTLEELSCNKVAVAQSIAVCHSTPYAWNPSPWESELCPPNETTIGQAAYTIGRTMFETDRCARQNVCTVSRARLSCGFGAFQFTLCCHMCRIPPDWKTKLNKMDEIWYVSGGPLPHKSKHAHVRVHFTSTILGARHERKSKSQVKSWHAQCRTLQVAFPFRNCHSTIVISQSP